MKTLLFSRNIGMSDAGAGRAAAATASSLPGATESKR
jgi:hypothetical protein